MLSFLDQRSRGAYTQFSPPSLDVRRPTTDRQYTAAPGSSSGVGQGDRAFRRVIAQRYLPGVPPMQFGGDIPLIPYPSDKAPRVGPFDRLMVLGNLGKAKNRSKEDMIRRGGKAVKGIEVTAAAISTASSIAMSGPPPWAQLAGASGYLTALGLQVVAGLTKKGNLALAGDAKAIAGFVRRSARWSEKKRERKAAQIAKKLERYTGKRAKRKGKDRRIPRRLKVRIAKLKLQAAALVGVWQESGKIDSDVPLIQGDPSTAMSVVELDPTADLDTPDDDSPEGWLPTIGGIPGGFVVGGLLLFGIGGAYLISQRR